MSFQQSYNFLFVNFVTCNYTIDFQQVKLGASNQIAEPNHMDAQL